MGHFQTETDWNNVNKQFIKSRGVKTFERNRDVCIFLILPKYQMYFLCRTAFQRLQKMFPVLQKITCFPEDKISQIYPDLQIEQVFNPSSYCTVFPSGASVSVWTLCNSCIWVPQLSSVWKDVSQKHTVILERVQNQRICNKKPEWFFWRTAASLTVQDKQWTHEQLSLNEKNKNKKQLWIN